MTSQVQNQPSPAGKKPLWKRRWFIVTAGLFVGILAFGAVLPSQEEDASQGSDSTPTAGTGSPPPDSPDEATSDSEAPATIAAPSTPAPTTAPPTTSAPVTTQPAPESVMPLIPCGTDLQLAQDIVQTAGVFYSRSSDATGRGRMQVMDRNWTVLYATPDPGAPIGEGDVVFYVVKDEEFQGC